MKPAAVSVEMFIAARPIEVMPDLVGIDDTVCVIVSYIHERAIGFGRGRYSFSAMNLPVR